jgi:hypothetical protein
MALPSIPPAVLARCTPACAGWALMAILQVLLGRFIPGNQASDDKLPKWAKISLTATELSLLAGVLLISMLLGILLERVAARLPSRAARIAAVALRGVGLWLFLLLWSISWLVFQGSGRFIDQRMLQFVFMNGAVMFEYLRASGVFGLIGILASTAAAATAWLVLAPRLLARLPERVRVSATRVVLGCAGLAFVVAAAGQSGHHYAEGSVIDLLSRSTHPLSKVYENRRDLRTGPLTFVLMSALRSGRDPSLPSSSGPVAVLRRPQVPMDQVLAGVDRKAERPDVVVLMIDSMRPDQLRAYGATRSVMPNLDALAAEGRVYRDARTQATHTNFATPCPFSSNYPYRSVDPQAYPGDDSYPRVMIWDVLKPLGYRTAMIGSQDERWGNMLGYMRTPGIDDVLQPDGRTRPDGETVDQALGWLDGVGKSPFFIYLNLQNPHWPFPIPDTWPRRFGKPRDFTWSFVGYDRKHVEDVRNLYADALAYSDEQIGRLFAALKKSGRWKNTLVVVMSDHGEAFREHGFAGHASELFDEVVRVPLVFHGPGVDPGTDPRPAQLIDVAPTVLGLLGLPTHPGFQGLDLRAKDFPARRSRFMVVQTSLANQFAVERDGYKLIHDRELSLDLLYDLRKDPGETVDQSQALPQVAHDLGWRLSVWTRAQLDYYGNRDRCRKEYPPVIGED